MKQQMSIISKYSYFLIVTVALSAGDVHSDNFTAKYPRAPFYKGPKHEPRFLTFNTEDTGDLTVDLEFAVPFITIPVKKSMDSAMGVIKGGSLANINVGALILGAAMVFGVAVVIPLFSSMFFKHTLVNPHYRNNEPDDTWRILALIDQALIENNIDTTSCMQRTMCWLAKNSRAKLNMGQATSQDKIIDGLLTNYWVNRLIEGSAVQAAVRSGLNDSNCSIIYTNCKFSHNALKAFINKISGFLYSKE